MSRTHGSTEATVVLVFENTELNWALGALLNIVQLLHVRLLLPNLTVQGSQNISTNSQRWLPGVERLDGVEQLLQPLLLLLPGDGVQLHALAVVPDVEGVGGDQVVPLQHLEIVHVKLCSETELRTRDHWLARRTQQQQVTQLNNSHEN